MNSLVPEKYELLINTRVPDYLQINEAGGRKITDHNFSGLVKAVIWK
jgi:hypothetical protein